MIKDKDINLFYHLWSFPRTLQLNTCSYGFILYNQLKVEQTFFSESHFFPGLFIQQFIILHVCSLHEIS